MILGLNLKTNKGIECSALILMFEMTPLSRVSSSGQSFQCNSLGARLFELCPTTVLNIIMLFLWVAVSCIFGQLFCIFTARKQSCGKVMFYTCWRFCSQAEVYTPTPADTTPPPPLIPRWALKWAVSILLECILVWALIEFMDEMFKAC